MYFKLIDVKIYIIIYIIFALIVRRLKLNYLAKKISSLILIIVILVTTIGFSIYSHHCYCNNLTDYSFFINKTECNNHSDESNKCCSLDNKVNNKQKKCCNKLSCCQTSLHFYKLTTLYDVPQAKNTLKFFCTIIFKIFENDKKSITDIKDKKYFKPIIIIPLLYGKLLIHFIHQLKIAPSVF